MTVHRPEVFNQAAVATKIEELDYTAKKANWVADWLKLAAPMAIKGLGADQLAVIATQGSRVLGFKPLPKMIPTLAKALLPAES